MSDEVVRVELPARLPSSGAPVEGVALVLLDRPNSLNALDEALLATLVATLRRLDDDPGCRCIVLAGSGERAFAAGADIRELAGYTPESLRGRDPFARWDEVAATRTPLVAAVRGYALGGGMELALACDLIVAGDDAVFALPELSLGIIPGAGGTQRLARAIGKARTAEIVLTGRRVPADEAERLGFVSRVVPAAETVERALELAGGIAALPPVAVRAAVDSIRAADELPLGEGLAHERRALLRLFGSEDQREGMAAFLEKRPPTWKTR